MKQYNLEWKPIESKYNGKETKYYRRKIAAQAQGKEFTEEQPARNIEEVFDRGVGTAKDIGKKAEVGFKKFGTFIGDKFKESGVKDKFKGLFAGN